jgi:hypothetical protein
MYGEYQKLMVEWFWISPVQYNLRRPREVDK